LTALAVEAAMKGGRDEARSVPHRGIGKAREQIHEPLLVRRLDGEDVDERDELGVLRDRGHDASSSSRWVADVRSAADSRISRARFSQALRSRGGSFVKR
jgi:hypothetical protein